MPQRPQPLRTSVRRERSRATRYHPVHGRDETAERRAKRMAPCTDVSRSCNRGDLMDATTNYAELEIALHRQQADDA